MSPPSTEELKSVIVDILARARDEGRLDQLTVRIVLREVADHYGIEEDVFHDKKYKSFIKATVYATMNSFDAEDGDAEPSQPKEEKSAGMAKTSKRKRRSRDKPRSSNEEPPEEADASEGEALPLKKAPVRSKPSKTKPGKAKPESESRFKSKAIIESSDEGAAESGARKPARSPKDKILAKTSPKQKQKVGGNSDIDMNTAGAPSSSSNPVPANESPKPSITKTKELPRDPMESELSSVIDEPPKRKKQEKESAKPQKDETAKRGKKEALSKDEETVNRLKGIVVACGLRKVWKKEFEGLDKPSQQIKRLHSILGDLGMKPRYSVEKAKAIREQRELAQELKDVQEFDKAIKRRGKGLQSSSETVESVDQNDSDANVPARKKQNARASIMAFLQDQSEEE